MMMLVLMPRGVSSGVFNIKNLIHIGYIGGKRCVYDMVEKHNNR